MSKLINKKSGSFGKALTLAVALVICLVLFCSCSEVMGEQEQTETEAEASNMSGPLTVSVMRLQSDIDDPDQFNTVYGAVQEWSEENGGVCTACTVDGTDIETLETTLFYAAKEEPSVVVCTGGVFSSFLDEYADSFQNVLFLSVGSGSSRRDNAASLGYPHEKAAFIAGYTAVADGYRELGFLGSIATDEVINCGYGFLQGADLAARKLGAEVSVKYIYTDSYVDCELSDTAAEQWFSEGTQVIFTYGHGMTRSALKSSAQYGGCVIAYETAVKEASAENILYIGNDRAKAICTVLDDYNEDRALDTDRRSDGRYICDSCIELDTDRVCGAFSEKSMSEALELIESGEAVPTVCREGDECPDLSIQVEFYS